LGCGLKITEVCSASLRATFFHGTSLVLILAKNGWATFWATFSQTHLVTLVGSLEIGHGEIASKTGFSKKCLLVEI
jgi:hypothetical protein